MIHKKITTALLVSGLCAAALPALNEADFQTKANSDGSVTITKYTGWDKDIVIPEKIGGQTVTAIGEAAFKNADLTSVTIPDSVKIIRESAFEGNKLAKLIFGKGVTYIEKKAFANNKLVSVAVPDGVVVAGRYEDGYESAFEKNPLTKVTLGADCLFPQGERGFGYFVFFSYMCNGRKAGTYTADAQWDMAWYKKQLSRKDRDKVLKQSADGYYYAETPYGLAVVDYTGSSKRLDIPDKIDGKQVKFIAGLARKDLTGVRIPDSVVSIGVDAFSDNKLTSGAIIGNSVTYIGSGAFSNCGLTSVTIPNSVKHIGGGAFQNNSLTTVTIPNSVKYISGGAFFKNQLTAVIIPDSVTTIGNYAFSDNELTSITIPNKVTSIGEEAFSDNELTSITIPNKVTSIGEKAFDNNRLTSITIPANVSLGSNMFSYGDFNSVYENNSKKAGTYIYHGRRYDGYWGTAEEVQAKIDAAKQEDADAQKYNEFMNKYNYFLSQFLSQVSEKGMNKNSYNTFVELYKLYLECKNVENIYNQYRSSIIGLYNDLLTKSQKKTFEKQFGKPTW